MEKLIRVGKNKFINKKYHDLLSEYFDLDDINGICKVKLSYDHFSDFFELNSANKPLLKGAMEEKLNMVFLDIPNAYKIHLQIEIKDYEGYSKEYGKTCFDMGSLLNKYKQSRLAHTKKILSFILLGLGILTLVVTSILKIFIFRNSDDMISSIVSEVLDIAAWVFIWEAVTIYFLDRTESRYKWDKFHKRVCKIDFI